MFYPMKLPDIPVRSNLPGGIFLSSAPLNILFQSCKCGGHCHLKGEYLYVSEKETYYNLMSVILTEESGILGGSTSGVR